MGDGVSGAGTNGFGEGVEAVGGAGEESYGVAFLSEYSSDAGALW